MVTSGWASDALFRDGHAFQAIAPPGRDVTLHADPVCRRAIERKTARRQVCFHITDLAGENLRIATTKGCEKGVEGKEKLEAIGKSAGRKDAQGFSPESPHPNAC